MLLNKVLFVSLLVLGLCILQPALGERLATRIAGGTQANPGQFPFMALIQYTYVDSTGTTVTYQGTGVIYNPTIVITSANAMNLCASGTVAGVYQNVYDLTNTTGAVGTTFTCNVGTTIIQAAGFTAGTYFNDFAYIDLSSVSGFAGFSGDVFARLPTSSPTAADIGRLFAVGYGEVIPGGQPSPILQYVQLNPQRNAVCNSRAIESGIQSLISFSENFCVSGFVKSPTTGFLTDACVLDAGGAIIRTQNIGSPSADYEVVGIINFATCSNSAPAIATYLWKYATAVTAGGKGLLPAQTNPPAAGSPANPRAFDGNFACGDGIVQAGALEKCDSSDVKDCCDEWTCQFAAPTTPCTLNNRNGTDCRQQPRCNKAGKCVVKFKRGSGCNGPNTRCNRGRCCTTPGLTNCFI